MTTSRPRSSRVREDRGSATAETAIVMPVVVVLLVALALMGVAGATQVRVDAAARAAARELARGEDQGAAVAAARRAAGADARVSVSQDGPWVRVEVTRVLRPSAHGALSGAAVTVRGQAQARLEPQLLGASAGRAP